MDFQISGGEMVDVLPTPFIWAFGVTPFSIANASELSMQLVSIQMT
jgi:hypothetical protein